MFFDSVNYLLFFPLVWLVYQVVPNRQRWVVLLAASLAFYATLKAPVLLLSLTVVVVVSYYCGLAISRQHDEVRRNRILWCGVAANIAVLCGVKYLRSLLEIWWPGLAAQSRVGNLFSTIGVSYYTLQAISYLADVYMEMAEPETHFGYFALYLTFFPKLLQGPIERAGDLLPQLKAPLKVDYDSLRSGLVLFGWGLFKKVAVANRLAIYVNTVYGNVHDYKGLPLAVATYMYAIQILADFSGYTDMALGVARMFNISLTQNFNSPYLATSIADFWRRWHISFSRWILDYIFKPLQLGWRSAGMYGTVAALLVTFLFSGVWHGASWNFAIWGLLHGVFLASSVMFKPSWSRWLAWFGVRQDSPVRRTLQTVLTFNLVGFAWIFFRANSVSDAWYVVTHLFSGLGTSVANALLLDKGIISFVLLTLSVGIMFSGSHLKSRIRLFERGMLVRWSFYYCLILALAYLAVYDNVGFVYLQF